MIERQIGKLHYFIFEGSKNPPKAQILWLHGICEHAMRYKAVALELCGHGYETVLVDHRAHGFTLDEAKPLRSLIDNYQKPAGELVKILPCLSSTEEKRLRKERLLEFRRITMGDHLSDLHELAMNLYDVEPHGFRKDIPLFITGHSMGGLLASRLALEFHRKENGVSPQAVVLLSPAFQPIAPPWNILAKFILYLNEKSYGPLKKMRPILEFIGARNFQQNTKWTADFISDDPIEKELFKKDPLISRFTTLNYFAAIDQLMKRMQGCANRYPLPILCIYGARDHIVHPKGTEKFLDSYRKGKGRKNLTTLKFPDVWWHELLRSSKKKDVMQKILHYIEEQASQSGYS